MITTRETGEGRTGMIGNGIKAGTDIGIEGTETTAVTTSAAVGVTICLLALVEASMGGVEIKIGG